MELAGFLTRNHGAHFATQCGAGGIDSFETFAPELITEQAMVCRSLFDHLLMQWPSLHLVAFQKRGSAPSLQDGAELPTQVDPVGNPHVHAVAPKRWVQVTGIAGK